jgi:hypothetical protein
MFASGIPSALAGTISANSISINDVVVQEGDSGTVSAVFTLTRSTPTGVSTVDYATTAGSATAPSDFAAVPTTTATFADGETTKAVTVTVNGDLTTEPDELFFVDLSNPTNATITDNRGAGRITNDDAPTIAYVALGQGTTDSALAQIDLATGVTTTIGQMGIGVTGLDIDPATGVLYAGSNRQSATQELLTVDTATGATTPVGPYNVEGHTAADITFTPDGALYGFFEPSQDDLYAIDKATGAATRVGEAGVGTGGSGTEAVANDTIYLTGSGSQGAFRTLDRTTGAATSLGTLDDATSVSINALTASCDKSMLYGTYGSDGAPNGLLVIDPATRHVTRLSTGTVMDAIAIRCPGAFEVSPATMTVGESGGAATVTVNRVGGADGPATVSYATASGTATSGSDFTSTSGTLSFAHGETSKTVTIPILNDDTDEGDEQFTFVLSNPTNGTALFKTTASTVTITDDDHRTFTSGYRLVAADGGVFTFGDRDFHGSTGSMQLNKPIVGGATNTSGFDGYWIVASDGGVFTFNADFLGSLADTALSAPAVEIEPTATGKGYWIVLADGKVLTFGDAQHFGDMFGKALNKPIIGMSVTPTGKGYWLVAGDGGIFNFGDAQFFGSMGDKPLNGPIIDLAPSIDNAGYYLLGRDGGVFTFGSADFKGSTGSMVLNAPVVAIMVAPNGAGYWLAAADGGVFTFGDIPFLGSMGGIKLNSPVIDLVN